jgi:hypothetical protein
MCKLKSDHSAFSRHLSIVACRLGGVGCNPPSDPSYIHGVFFPFTGSGATGFLKLKAFYSDIRIHFESMTDEKIGLSTSKPQVGMTCARSRFPSFYSAAPIPEDFIT